VINILLYTISIVYSGEVIDIPSKELVDLGGIFGPAVVVGGEWWRLVSAIFLHGSMTHLLMNMFSLYIVGRPTELYFSTKEYLILYFTTAILGGLVSISIHPLSVSIGASGAIFGIFGALSGYLFAFRDRLGKQAHQLMKEFGVIIGINLVLGLSIPNIDMGAHIGGLISGIIGGFIVAKYPQKLWLFLLLAISVMVLFYYYLPSLYR
jgi:rhomboid protease GluP